jgi:putative membrane-bound dehydrogenase-like protein
MKHLLAGIFLLLPSFVYGQGFSPEEAVKRMKVPDGFQVKLVACEPMIRQPLSIDFDERGRMWVLQYLQYPNPAGLKAVKQDQYLRTVWDRVPEPPPKGPKGLDRITICYDPDENGRYRKSKDFVTGLNLATGFCIGNGGVYVVQPPYLLFYPDKNRDDVPDGDPEVLVSGFGMEDTHSYANSLQWGPDGWLYGAHGSTVTAKIKNPAGPNDPPLEFQQGIWRYHPKTKQFELFSEGGGNTYGLDFDKHGQAIAGTNYGNAAMLHQMQGAYYIKGFTKHGPLHNPYAYGYFDHVPYENFKGGHVTCGGIVYQADAYPPEFRDTYIAGNLLSNAVYWHKMTPKGSSFTAKHGGDFLIANDTWFRPVDCFQGPDGSVYVADWYDRRAAHLDPVDNWDKTNGRIYKVEYKGTKPAPEADLAKKSSTELIELLKHPNKGYRNEAKRLLTEKGANTEDIEKLKTWAVEEKGVPALEALWAIHSMGAFDESLALKLLKHPDEQMRAWAVRLVGDGNPSGKPQGWEKAISEIDELVYIENSAIVYCQIAATAKRIPGEAGRQLTQMLVTGRKDLPKDPAVPLMVWWAIDSKSDDLFNQWGTFSAYCASGADRDFILERVAHKMAATNSSRASELLQVDQESPTKQLSEHHRTILRGFDLGLTNPPTDAFKSGVVEKIRILKRQFPNEPIVSRLLIRLGDESAIAKALALARDKKLPDGERLKKIDLVAEARRMDGILLYLDIFQNTKSDVVRLGALSGLQGFGDPVVGKTVLALYPNFTGAMRQKAQALLLSRSESALDLLELVDKGKIPVKELSVDQLRPILEFKNSQIAKLVEKHYGKIGAATPGEKQARIAWLNVELSRGAPADPAKGKAIFTKSCAVCHTLFGEGGKVGPDLTTADRKNRGYMLANIVDPSLYIRQEFVSYNVTTLDGRKFSGLVGEASPEAVTLFNVVNDQVQKTKLVRADIDDMKASPLSLMPEKILDALSYAEIKDLFAYMSSDRPAKPKDPASSGGKKLKVLLISGSLEYKSDDSLAALQKMLEANYPVECSRAFRKADDDLPGLEGLDTCDVAVFFTRRLTIKGDQLDRVKRYALSGKPIVAIRTASHGFQNWLDMDKEVLGGNYKNHYGHGLKCESTITDAGGKHPVMKGVKPFATDGGLYKNPDLGKDVTILMNGTIPTNTEPIAWVREYKRARIFYTSLGHPDDFKNENFTRMLVNAVFWTTKREVPAK